MEGDGLLEGGQVKREPASVRQLAVTAFAGGLAPAAAGEAYGWQGAALAVPLALLAGWIAIRLAPRWTQVEARLPGHILKVCHGAFGAALLSRGLSRSADRLAHTGGGDEAARLWLILLWAAVLVWMSRGKPAAFFRTAEICCLAMAAVSLAVLVWGVSKVQWRYLALPEESLSGGLLAALETAGTFLFAIPYIYKEAVRPGDGGRAMGWLTALTVGSALLAAVTAGVLSPGVLTLAEEPFFAMTAALGRSVRVDGLVSALWLLSDMIYLGFLSQSWRRAGWERDWLPAAAVILAALGAVFRLPDLLPGAFWGVGMAVLWGISAVILWLGGKK